jgi:hypothetical protein
MINYNGLGIPIKEINNEKYVDFNYFLLAHRNYSGNCVISYEIKKLPENTWIKEKKGRNVSYYVNGYGVLDFVQRSISMQVSLKKSIVEQLVSHGMIEDKKIMYFVRKEISFLDSLSKYMSVFNLDVGSQVRCGDYLIDFVIGKTAIEYDENDHAAYNKILEQNRSDFIKSIGFNLIRLSDKKSDIENIAILVKFMGGIL